MSVDSAVPVTEVTRVSPTGSTVGLVIPESLGEHTWYATTRLAGDRTVRQFTVAPVGQHEVIPSRIMPGATRSDWQFHGHDVVLFEAPERRDACLLWIGPYHEATTWFGGPAPSRRGLNRLLGSVEFADDPNGAVVRPRVAQYTRQFGTTVIGSGPTSYLAARPAPDALGALPDWAGLTLAGGELWRSPRMLSGDAAASAAGTIHEFRYLLANPTCALDIVLNGPEAGGVPADLGHDDLTGVLDALRASWTD